MHSPSQLDSSNSMDHMRISGNDPLIQSICFVCIQSFHNADDFCFVDINILTDFKNACYLQIVRRTKFCIEQ